MSMTLKVHYNHRFFLIKESDDGDGVESIMNHTQDSNSNDDDHNSKHSDDDGNSVKKDKTPFVLSTPVPFP
jgi:hypothetical protein